MVTSDSYVCINTSPAIYNEKNNEEFCMSSELHVFAYACAYMHEYDISGSHKSLMWDKSVPT